EAPLHLRPLLANAHGARLRDMLHALHDLRAEAAAELMPLLETAAVQHADLMLEVLSFSRDREVGPWLRAWTTRRVPMARRAQWRRQALPARRSSVPADFPYRAVLRALRRHGSPETEAFLIVAANDWDPVFRCTAIASLGWWEPFRRTQV